jgi:predicted membrane-bound spermidine synthase
MWRIYVGIALMALVALGAWHYRHVVAENARLKTELKMVNSMVVVLDQAATAKAAIHETERNRIDEIEDAPDSDDGPVAPVLRRTLDGLR